MAESFLRFGRLLVRQASYSSSLWHQKKYCITVKEGWRIIEWRFRWPCGPGQAATSTNVVKLYTQCTQIAFILLCAQILHVGFKRAFSRFSNWVLTIRIKGPRFQTNSQNSYFDYLFWIAERYFSALFLITSSNDEYTFGFTALSITVVFTVKIIFLKYVEISYLLHYLWLKIIWQSQLRAAHLMASLLRLILIHFPSFQRTFRWS